MYSHVLIGYDGSQAAQDGLALGRRLAAATGANPVVVCVHPFAPVSARIPGDPEPELSMRRAAEIELEQARRELGDFPAATFRTVAETSVGRALHQAAEEADAALIVLGSTHRSGLGRIVPGTTADQVLHAAPCAVAIAPDGYAKAGPERFGVVGAGVSGDVDTERVAAVAGRIARGAGARLRLITVVARSSPAGPFSAGAVGSRMLEDAARKLTMVALQRADRAAGAGLEITVRGREGRVDRELVAESEDLDLLVLGSRGYGPLNRVLMGSVSARVIRDAACPVLVIPHGVAPHSDDAVAAITQATAS